MSQMDSLVGDLRAMANGVDQAQRKAAAAAARVQDVASQAVRAGFAGIAAALVPVEQAVGQIRAKLASLNGTVGDTSAVVAAVPEESSLDETAVALGKAGQQLETVRAEIGATLAQVEQTQKLVATVLRGGQPGPLLSALSEVKGILHLLATRCGAAAEQVETAARTARQVGQAGN